MDEIFSTIIIKKKNKYIWRITTMKNKDYYEKIQRGVTKRIIKERGR